MTDLFCGAGGATTGASMVPGVQVVQAVDWWGTAVDTHARNHPHTTQHQQNISTLHPGCLVGTDILWASPECTGHTSARGGVNWAKPGVDTDADKVLASRATMWDVPRFTAHHRYRAVIVENVVEVASWGDETSGRGGLFRQWLSTMRNLGYDHRVLSVNALHASLLGSPVPQSRDRGYIIFWPAGSPAPDADQVIRPWAWCPSCEQNVRGVQAWKKPNRDPDTPGRYGPQYVYQCPGRSCHQQRVEPVTLPAASILDWTNLGVRIRDREKPLAVNTIHRIQAGMTRFWGVDPQRPLVVSLRRGCAPRTVDQPLPTMTTHRIIGVACTQQRDGVGGTFIMRSNGVGGRSPAYLFTPVSRPMPTVTTRISQQVVHADTRLPLIEDVRYRMVAVGEVKRAMGFPDSYVLAGSKQDQSRLAGNAVCPPVARDLVAVVTATLTRGT